MNFDTFRNSGAACRLLPAHRDQPRHGALPLRIDEANVISVVFNRSHADFRNRERAMLDAVRHPLAAIYRNLAVREEAGIGLKRISQLAAEGGWHMMQVTLGGRILDASPTAIRLLARFFPDYAAGPRRHTCRPRCSRGWRAAVNEVGDGQGPPLIAVSISPRRISGSRLSVHFVAGSGRRRGWISAY